ncbi:hypothetical protein [Pseudomonas sp. p1(2021b)]|uniref:hypothetical protein n=1 Tax=Pseudomonas sp. p1(2021b) TaxID=2874628 RepID=UPI003D2B1302
MLFYIGKETTLNTVEWARAFNLTIDSQGNETHATYVFLMNNRFDHDNNDHLLFEYFEHYYDGEFPEGFFCAEALEQPHYQTHVKED